MGRMGIGILLAACLVGVSGCYSPDEGEDIVSIAIIRPNGEGEHSSPWDVSPAGLHFSAVDDVVEQPAGADTGDFVFLEGGGVDAGTDEYEMETVPGVALMTGIKIWIYAKTANSDVPFNIGYVGIQIGQPWSYKTLSDLFTTDWTWYSAEWTDLEWSQADLDKLRIRLSGQVWPDGGSVYVAGLYAEITVSYEAPVNGGGARQMVRGVAVRGVQQWSPAGGLVR